MKVTEPLRFFFCRFLLESAAGLFLVCVAAPRLSIWIFTFQKFRLEVLAVKYAPRKVYIKESGGYVELSYTDFCRRRQADKGYMDKLFIPVQGCLLEVVREQYADFYRDRERWRYLQKLDARNSLLSLDGFTDTYIRQNPGGRHLTSGFPARSVHRAPDSYPEEDGSNHGSCCEEGSDPGNTDHFWEVPFP